MRGGVVAGALALAPLSPPKATAHAAPALKRTLPARADSLVGFFGVCIHLNHQLSAYGDHARVAEWLQRLGVRHVRTRLSPTDEVLDTFEDLAGRGIRIQATCGQFGDPQTMDELMHRVRQRYHHPASVFTAFEGINEPNNDGVPWVAETRRKTRALYEARARYRLGSIPIVAPALARVPSGGVEGRTTWEQACRVGDLSRYVDFGNMHVYPRGYQPSSDIPGLRRCALKVAGPGRTMCTEGGYFTAMGVVGPNPVPEAVAAAYAPQAILEHWRAGTGRFFRYEFLDDPNPTSRDREGTLGMVNTGSTWTPKADFAPTRFLLRAFADPGPAFTPRPLDMTLSNKPRDLRSLLFAKRNGTHLLALWLDRKIYDPTTRRMVFPGTTNSVDTVRLTIGSPRKVTVQHLTDLGHTVNYRSTKDVRIGLTAGVTLVTLGPG